MIHLNETTGYISLSSNLNTNVPISAAMEISVSGKLFYSIFPFCTDTSEPHTTTLLFKSV